MEVTNRKRYLTLRRGKDNRYLSSLLSRIATKVQMLYRRHDSDDEVWCYRSTEETLTLLQASPRDRGRNWESARGNGERLQKDSKMEQQGPERSSKKNKREGEQGDEIHLICSVIHHFGVLHTFTRILQIHEHTNICVLTLNAWRGVLRRLCFWSCGPRHEIALVCFNQFSSHPSVSV